MSKWYEVVVAPGKIRGLTVLPNLYLSRWEGDTWSRDRSWFCAKKKFPCTCSKSALSIRPYGCDSRTVVGIPWWRVLCPSTTYCHAVCQTPCLCRPEVVNRQCGHTNICQELYQGKIGLSTIRKWWDFYGQFYTQGHEAWISWQAFVH